MPVEEEGGGECGGEDVEGPGCGEGDVGGGGWEGGGGVVSSFFWLRFGRGAGGFEDGGEELVRGEREVARLGQDGSNDGVAFVIGFVLVRVKIAHRPTSRHDFLGFKHFHVPACPAHPRRVFVCIIIGHAR